MNDGDPRTYAVIGAAMEVHGILGPGFLEHVYHDALAIELGLRNIPFVSKPKLTLTYKGRLLSRYYVPDYISHGSVVTEIKASSRLTPNDEAQLFNSLLYARKRLGLLINFGEPSLKWRRFTNIRVSSQEDAFTQ